MWKSGKRWVYGTLFFLGMTTAIGMHNNTVSDAEETNDTKTTNSVDSAAAAVTQGQVYTLQNQGHSAAASSATNGADDGVATSSTSSTASSAASVSAATSQKKWVRV